MLCMILVIIKHLKSYLETLLKKMTICGKEGKQDEFKSLRDLLSDYPARKKEYIEEKDKLLINVKNFYKGRKKFIEGFKNGRFPFNNDETFE